MNAQPDWAAPYCRLPRAERRQRVSGALPISLRMLLEDLAKGGPLERDEFGFGLNRPRVAIKAQVFGWVTIDRWLEAGKIRGRVAITPAGRRVLSEGRMPCL